MDSTKTNTPFCAHRQPPSLTLLIAAMVIGTGCQVARPAPQPTTDARITVEFRQPTVVSVQTAAPDRVPLAGVTELRGRVELITADTVYVRIKGASGPDLKFRDVPINGIAAVARPDTHFSEYDFSGGRTAALAFGTAAALGLAFLAYIFVFFQPA